jgi:hypothetical protein
MTRLGFVPGIMLALPLQLSAQSPPPATCPQPSRYSAILTAVAFEEAVAAQDRINRYMHRDVVPSMKECWARLASRGSVSVRLQYERAGDRWLPGPSAVRRAMLDAGEGELALQCLQAAVADTSFPVEAADRESSKYVVNWSFPVPWPADDAEAIRTALDNGGGGSGDCGGPEDPPACMDCAYVPVFGWMLCVPSCVGYLECNKIPHGCEFPNGTKCITGGVFRNRRGIAIYPSR